MPNTPSGSNDPRKPIAPEAARPEPDALEAADPESAGGNVVPRNLKPYYLCLLRRGRLWNETEGQEDLGPRHLAFLRSQVDAGRLVAAGPVLDVPGQETATQDRQIQNGGEAEPGTARAITGITLMRAANLEEAISLAKQDPAVAAERLTVEVRPVLLPSLDAVRVEF